MSKKYFSELNYSLANEDSSVEYEMVKLLNSQKILSVCGSGGRSLPLLATNPQKLHCVDLALQQLGILKLRIETIKLLEHRDFLKFWGYAPYGKVNLSDFRKKIFYKLNLEEVDKSYFEKLFVANSWNSILYAGSWERTFNTFSKIVRLILGKKHSSICFSFNDLEKQKKYFDNDFPWWRWNIVLHILGNKSVFNALLYKGEFVKKNINETYFKYYAKAFKHLFYNSLTKKSFFLQLCFRGYIFDPAGNTIEADKQCFLQMKNALKTSSTVTWSNQDLISAINQSDEKFDFISMSDVPSYFSGEVETSFLQEIVPGLNKGAVIVIRSYLRVPNVDIEGYEDITLDYKDLIDLEKVQMYRFNIYRRI